ncbi:hypothetical protein AGMMS49940_14670 [Spirochaetia bacterium]|nr:hypothetical protein AGMMS49940_14670 [Spirochaetia bacterium]
MIKFTQKYNRGAWLSFLEDSFLPDDFTVNEREVSFSEKLEYTQTVTKLGESPSLGLTVFEIKHKSTNDARVGLSKEAFRLVCNYTLHSRALVLFVPQDKDDFYRFSLIEFTPIVNEKGKVKRDYSNPRRYSFILGRDAKVKTPQQYLVQKGRVKDTVDLKNRFSVEVLTKEFYSELFKWYDDWAIKEVAFPQGFGANVTLAKGEQNRIHLIRLITRLIFVWFIKQKGLIPEWIFDKDEIADVLKTFKSKSLSDGNYYNGIIQNLFFATLNKPINERDFANEKERKEDYGIKNVYRDTLKESLFQITHDEFKSRLDSVPFLNGGLFECLDNFDDKAYIDGFSREKNRCAFVPNALFWGNGEQLGIIELFNLYNFTIEENTPQDVDVALDPELLGKAFENLLGTFNPETLDAARNATGSFYTPREIVSYMVDSSLKEYFKNYLKDDKDADSKLEALFSYQIEGTSFSDKQVETLISAINNSKILDPACGSGAFPMGILQRLVHILGKLDPGNKLWEDIQRNKAVEETEEAYKIGDKEKRNERLTEISDIFQQNSDDYGRKLFLIENCIYGIDIQPIAIQISKLRFFISLIVNQEKSKNKDDNYGIRPLPNLETKFVAANTLIGVKRESGVLVDPEIEKVQKQLLVIRHQHFSARNAKEKIELRKEDRQLAKELAEILKNDGFYNSHDAEQMAKWNPYDQNTPSDFFDPEWMFGVVDGFDVVIGNPPYVQIPKGRVSAGFFPFSEGKDKGKQNLYKVFIEAAYNLAKNNGCQCLITQSSLLCDLSSQYTRELLLTKTTLKYIIEFPKVAPSQDGQVFQSVLQGTCISLAKKTAPDIKHIFSISIDNDITTIMQPIFEKIAQSSIQEIYPDSFDIPLIKTGEFEVIQKIDRCSSKFKSIIKSLNQGDINLTASKSYISNIKSKTKLLRGRNVAKYHVNYNVDEYLKAGYKKELVAANKTSTFLVCQEVTGTVDKWRLHFALTDTDETFLFGHTVNKILLRNEDDNLFLLALLNSKLLDWYFRKTSTNNHVGGYEIEQLPVKIPSDEKPIIALVDKILAAKSADPKADTRGLEARIDGMVYELYGLGEEEIKVVEGKR